MKKKKKKNQVKTFYNGIKGSYFLLSDWHALNLKAFYFFTRTWKRALNRYVIAAQLVGAGYAFD